jgi:hypothetical protein
MCGKQRGYKSFVFVSAARKGLTADYSASAVNKGVSGRECGNDISLRSAQEGVTDALFVSAVNKGLRGNVQSGTLRRGVPGAVGRERVRKLLKRRSNELPSEERVCKAMN